MDAQRLVDPEIAEALSSRPTANFGGLTLADIPALRTERAAARIIPRLSDAVERIDHHVPSGDGGPDVVLRVHRPLRRTKPLPCVYWMHGGGLIFGTYEMEDARFDDWVQRFDCIGVSVEYRLAPEHPYPAPLEDCYAGLTWVHQHASELDIDTGHLGIGGASSGAGLAAGLALLTRDRGRIPLAFQLLIYPMIDDRQVTSSSQWEVPVWPPSANALGWSAYLGEAYGGDVPMYAAAARATDLTNLPPALVVVGGVDGFVDEDVDFARRLNAAGIPTELHMYPGAVHGFDGMAATAAVAQRARRDIDDWLARQLGREPSKRD